MPKSILITGAAGYIGAMLCDQFSRAPELQKIIAIDLLPQPELLRGNDKIVWITADLSGSSWQRIADKYQPEVVIHCAWQIKELYGKRDLQRKLNIDGSRNLFTFAFRTPSVKKIIHFSTVSAYGAFAHNKLENRFTEEHPLLESQYLYAKEKIEAEKILTEIYNASGRSKQVFVVRPASITGPRGRKSVGKKGLLYMLDKVLPFVPVASGSWTRQYAHEDDVTDFIGLLTFNDIRDHKGYDALNLSAGDYVFGRDMARIFKKSVLPVLPFLVRVAFFCAWHGTRGKIPTGRGAWKYFCYSIPVSGEKAARDYGFEYSYNSKEALEKNEGRYA